MSLAALFPASAVEAKVAELKTELKGLRSRLRKEKKRRAGHTCHDLFKASDDRARALEHQIDRSSQLRDQLHSLRTKDEQIDNLRWKLANEPGLLTTLKGQRIQKHLYQAELRRESDAGELLAGLDWLDPVESSRQPSPPLTDADRQPPPPPPRESEFREPPRKKARTVSYKAPTTAAVAVPSEQQSQAALAQAWEAGRRGVPLPFLAAYTGHGFSAALMSPPPHFYQYMPYPMHGVSYPAAQPPYYAPSAAQPPFAPSADQTDACQRPMFDPGYGGANFPGYFPSAFDAQAAQLQSRDAVAVHSRRQPTANVVKGEPKEDIDDKSACYR